MSTTPSGGVLLVKEEVREWNGQVADFDVHCQVFVETSFASF
jgi:hypothetical protein